MALDAVHWLHMGIQSKKGQWLLYSFYKISTQLEKELVKCFFGTSCCRLDSSGQEWTLTY